MNIHEPLSKPHLFTNTDDNYTKGYMIPELSPYTTRIDSLTKKAHAVEERLGRILRKKDCATHPLPHTTTLAGRNYPIEIISGPNNSKETLIIHTTPPLAFPFCNLQRYIAYAKSQGYMCEKESRSLQHLSPETTQDPMPQLIVEEQLLPLYKTLSRTIKHAFKEAKKLQKPLLIIIGENHYEKKHLLIQSILLNIAEKYAIRSLLVEASPCLLEEIRHAPKEEKTIPSEAMREECKENIYSIVPIAQEHFGMHIHPYDPLRETFLHSMQTNPLAPHTTTIWKERQAAMHSAILAHTSHALCITGTMHLKDILEDSQIQEKFTLLAINEADSLHEHLPDDYKTDAYHFAMNPSHALQVYAPVNPYRLKTQEIHRIATGAAHLMKKMDRKSVPKYHPIPYQAPPPTISFP